MQEELKIIDGAFKKDDPHKDIGKQKFRVRRAYTTWVEYDVVADSKEEAEVAVREHGGIDKIEWQEGYHNDEPVEVYATNRLRRLRNVFDMKIGTQTQTNILTIMKIRSGLEIPTDGLRQVTRMPSRNLKLKQKRRCHFNDWN